MFDKGLNFFLIASNVQIAVHLCFMKDDDSLINVDKLLWNPRL